MKNISIEKNKIIKYIIVTVVFYLLLVIAWFTRGADGYPETLMTSVWVMPLAVGLLGVIHVDIKKRWLRILLGVLLFVYMPGHIINFVLGDFEISLIQNFVFNCLAIYVLIGVVMACTLSFRWATVISGGFCFFVLVLNSFVTVFRGKPVTPGDISAIGTSLKVFGNYSYFINISMVSSVMYGVLLMELINIVKPDLKGLSKKAAIFLRSAFVLSAAGAAVLVWIFAIPLSAHKYMVFETALSNRYFGTLMTYVVSSKLGMQKEPEGYSRESAEKLLESLPDVHRNVLTQEKPNIIVIMNEAFSDLDQIYDTGADKDPLVNWHSLKENTIDGNMLVSITGGGTSHTEFEFLTGCSGGIMPPERTPYVDYIKDETYSLAWDLKKEGYKNIAIHPFWSSCWNRNVVYPFFGFDDYIFGEDFGGEGTEESSNHIDEHGLMSHTDFGDDLEYVRDYISDRESYRKVIEQFENKEKDERLFVFNVTVQNHSGFSDENYPAEITTDKGEDPGQTSQYLTLLKESDTAYGELIDYFKSYDEPTVILMFGDHQPGIPFLENLDHENIREEYRDYGNEVTMSKYIVPYKLWTNYDIPEESRELTSANMLSLTLKDAAGLPYNKWDNFRSEFGREFDGVVSRGYWLNDKKGFYKGGSEKKDDLINKYRLLEYYLVFDGGMTDK